MEEKRKSELVVILLGPPGSGKGTQASLLADKFNLHYFETSKVLESAWTNNIDEVIEVEGEKYSLKKEKEELWEKGKLCSPPPVTVLVKRKISELSKQGKNILFAGSPRTLYEAERIAPLLEELYGKENIKVVLIEITAEQTIFRNSQRRICELMRHPILYSEETKSLEHCPLDGSNLLKRDKLDDPESIKVRIKEYKNRTLPVVDFLEKRGFEVKRINGEQSVADVFSDILQALI